MINIIVDIRIHFKMGQVYINRRLETHDRSVWSQKESNNLRIPTVITFVKSLRIRQIKQDEVIKFLISPTIELIELDCQ